jgi:lipopolysaccharide exporter
VAGPAVAVLLGPQWAAAVPLLQLFTVCGLTSAIQSNLIMVIVALGKPKANTMLSGAMLVLYLPALAYASLQYGALGAAWVHLVMSCVVLVPLHIVFLRMTGLSAARYFGALWRPLAGAAVMGAVVLLLQRQLAGAAQPWPALLQLLVCICAGAISYVTMVLTLWHAAGRPAASAEGTMLASVAGRFQSA